MPDARLQLVCRYLDLTLRHATSCSNKLEHDYVLVIIICQPFDVGAIQHSTLHFIIISKNISTIQL